jgi:hypothetical protein
MKQHPLWLVILVLGLGTAVLARAPRPAAAQEAPPAVCSNPALDIPGAECAALASFYNSTNGAGWTAGSGWLVSPAVCDDWLGISCAAAGGVQHVTAIELLSNNLSGPLPADIAALSELHTLNLFDNFLSGSIPTALGSMPALTTIDLGLNLLEGQIPFPLTASTGALFLYLDGNRLSGAPPAAYCTANLASVTWGHNMLDVYGADPCLSEAARPFSGWELTQTVPPLGVRADVEKLSGRGPQETPAADVSVSWTPITFQGGAGGYQVFSGGSTAGPFADLRATVTDKSASSVTFSVEGDPQSYVFVVRAFTTAAEGVNKSTLTSLESNTAVVDGVAITLLDAGAAPPQLYLALLGPLALLLLSFLAIRRARA